MSVTSVDSLRPSRALAWPPAWFCLAIGAAVMVLLLGPKMLFDTDTLWQIKVGEWILANRAVPYVDIYSLTRTGEPWMSSSWLSQVLFALAYAAAGWTGVILLCALALGGAVALLTRFLEQRLSPISASFVAIMAFTLSSFHFFARPHVLAMPVMVAWACGLIAAADRSTRPSFGLLGVLVLWANLHGSFVFGVVLLGGVALDVLWRAEPEQRRSLFVQWALFGLAGVAACCLTPYGWNVLLAAHRILDLGELLQVISEWRPVDFSVFVMFEGALLALIGSALYFGVRLPPTRIVLMLGLLHMALAHMRNVEVFVLLLPVIALTPVADQFGLARRHVQAAAGRFGLLPAIAVAAGALALFASVRGIRMPEEDNYASAVAALREHHATRVFNDYGFGGYMIWVGMKPLIDGRAELYGERFALDHWNALLLKDPDAFFRAVETYDLDAAVFYAGTPLALLMAHIDGWKKVFSNDLAVVYIRTGPVTGRIRANPA
ncbi:hypothetical protein JQ557_10465 [Bradyrhizobium sp. U87765 SZCCT0131]|uniref:hypothetical protein n=1 Tax=unclassified Bradyrhizobium TaxID=2631580 RepID=UPI001BAC9304|nr:MULTISPECIES: hypothetical protein [unclassified Bradyrhizobium]MBR1218413.1 hypothetical protein [Bradyrhizobium sp. U87765 SZCCT0131]MBR1260641.1 hypothetical protein [Bradyrhizobium sp. U87765 SZCCT0134]MBR1303911.1 hypothetical protein [Bradyrhizobium sp. U87765 SZCCT0110]MBR1319517.1 hypothetical protein [Bradyrhizobium sp. U87765 SZCCT0109]MBR1347842.1 hypothetical protein [Bradyrhizobium sp. U87765 SZCCT0048]